MPAHKMDSITHSINRVSHPHRDLIMTLVQGFEHWTTDECIVAPATDESVRSILRTAASATLARRSTLFAQ